MGVGIFTKFKFLVKLRNQNLAFLSLAIIFAILLIQTAVLLFADSGNSEGLNDMDIIFRTALSSLFGFFMSSSSTAENDENSSNNVAEAGSKKQKEIGFAVSETVENKPLAVSEKSNRSDEKMEIISPKITLESKRVKGNLRIIILSTVCVFCLTMMIIVRHFSHMLSDGNYALLTMSMYRDFISSSLGAIIGLAKGGKN